MNKFQCAYKVKITHSFIHQRKLLNCRISIDGLIVLLQLNDLLLIFYKIIFITEDITDNFYSFIYFLLTTAVFLKFTILKMTVMHHYMKKFIQKSMTQKKTNKFIEYRNILLIHFQYSKYQNQK